MVLWARAKTRSRTNPLFYEERLRRLLGDDEERIERVRTDPHNVDVLVWNLFASLATHRDQDWLAYRLQLLGGNGVRPPVRLSLFAGRDRGPLLAPPASYLDSVRRRLEAAGADLGALEQVRNPIEAAVRIESPDVLALVHATLMSDVMLPSGRSPVVELVDAGLEHARRIGKSLTVTVLYASGTPLASELSARVGALRDPARLAAELGHRETVPPVALREVSWQQLFALWEGEREQLELDLEPVDEFLDHARALRLR